MVRIVTLLLFVSTISSEAFSQFTSITQSTTNSFQFAEISEGDGVALIGGIKALKSVDDGFTWNEMNIGVFAMPTTLYNFTDAIIISPQVYCLVGRDNTNYKSIIIRTTDGGNTWTNVLESANGSHNYFKDICYNGAVAIATAKNGVYRSTDNGVSWNFVAVSGMTGISDVVQYNDISNVWVIEKFSSYKYKSTDNGASWTATPYFGYSGNIYHIGNIDDKFLATWSTNTSSALFRFDEDLLTIDTIVLDAVKTFSTLLEKSYYLPNSDIMTYSNAFFIKVDTATENTYYYNHNLVDPVTGELVQTNDFDFDQTYGLAVGQYGGLSRFDAAQPEELYVPADFTLTSNTCPGDTIFAEALFDYADSVKWFFDGNLVSTDTNLIYETPYQFGTFDLVHHTWFNGLVKSDTQQVYFAPLNPATPYSFGYVDTIPCYQTGALTGVVSPGNINWNGALEVWFDSVMLDSIAPQPTSNFSFTTPIIDSQDTLYLVSKNKQTCGTSVDSTQIILYPGDDLYDDYQLIPSDSAICLFDTTQLNLLNTNANYTYNLTITNDFTPSVTNLSPTGTGTDTMNVIGPVGVTENNYDYDNTNYFFELVISDDTENCQTSTIHLDTIVCIDPRSLFHTHSKSFYRNDTVEITNVRIKQNRLWEVSPNGLNVLNVNDTVPIVYGDTTGVYELALTNEPIVGCSSRSNEFVTYSDSLESIGSSVCNEESGESRHKVMKVKLDNQGNIFELGVIKTSSYSRPAFHLTKRDSEGQFMWEQKAWFSNFSLKGVVIEDIDFDENGDVYAALWIDGEAGFSHELISYYPTSGTNTRRGYVVKFDGQTGDMIWAKDLADYPLFLSTNPSVYAYWRIMSIVVTDSEIHFAVGTTQSIFIVTTTLSGDYIDQSSMNGFRSPDNMLVYMGSTGGPSQSNHSPRLMEMNNGDILGVAYYTDGSVYSNSTLIPGMNIPQGKHGIMAFKYNSQDGLYDFKKLAEMSELDAFSESLNGIPMFDLDKNDNLSVGFNWREDVDTLSILDSVIVAPEGTCVFQVDKDFDLRWITVGNYSYLNSVEVAAQTGETFVSGITRDNISFSNGDTHKMLGGYGQYSTEYGTAFNFWEMETYQYKPQDLYLVRMDSTGSPNGGYLFDDQNTVSFCSRRVSNKIDITPCGDIVCVVNQNDDCFSNYGSSSYIEESGLTVSIDSSKTLILRSDCLAPVCSILNLGYDSLNYCSSYDSLFVQLGSASYNVSEVTYDLIENGSVISSQTANIDTSGFYLTLPNSTSDFSIEITSPGPMYDSVAIIYLNQTSPTYSFDSLMCWGESQVITGTPSTFNYLWLGDSSLSNSPLVDTSFYNQGVNNLDVISTDQFGCETYDTLNIYVYEPINPNLDSLYFLSCEADTVLPVQSNNYTNEEWFVNGSSSNNLFSETNLNTGLNIIDVTLTDTNSCVEQYSTSIDLQEPVYPNLNNSYNLPCGSDTILPVESSNYTGEEWLLNGSPTANFFSSSNLNIGVNNISVTLTDTNGCIEQYNTEIDYCYDLGVNESVFSTIEVIPNPNTGKFEVRFKNFDMDGKLSLVSSMGQIVFEKERIFHESFTIEVNAKPGVYWLLFDTDSSRLRRKIIICD